MKRKPQPEFCDPDRHIWVPQSAGLELCQECCLVRQVKTAADVGTENSAIIDGWKNDPAVTDSILPKGGRRHG